MWGIGFALVLTLGLWPSLSAPAQDTIPFPAVDVGVRGASSPRDVAVTLQIVFLLTTRIGEFTVTMSESSSENITLYVSSWCAHSRSVERFLDQNGIPVHKIKIDGDSAARAELIDINNGYASVPTLVFSDGSKLTEPSLNQLRHKFGLESSPSLMGRIRGILGDKDSD